MIRYFTFFNRYCILYYYDMQISLITNRKGKNIWINYKVKVSEKNDKILEIEMRNMVKGTVQDEILNDENKKYIRWQTKVM